MSQLYRALVIDDEPAARRLLKSLLAEHSNVLEVIGEAGNGRDAIEKINDLKPDVIFLDIQMPDLTGFEVIDRLQQ
jgi:two-component system LytT family response regulator